MLFLLSSILKPQDFTIIHVSICDFNCRGKFLFIFRYVLQIQLRFSYKSHETFLTTHCVRYKGGKGMDSWFPFSIQQILGDTRTAESSS